MVAHRRGASAAARRARRLGSRVSREAGRDLPITLCRVKKLLPFVVDAVLVVVFCAIGRSSHDESILSGLARTAWPFETGLILGWVIAFALVAWQADRDFDSAIRRFDGSNLWPTGVIIWLSTLIFGMLLRVVSGQGTAFNFILVAATALALFLLGPRLVRKAVRGN